VLRGGKNIDLTAVAGERPVRGANTK
jgi:hypothetical protein